MVVYKYSHLNNCIPSLHLHYRNFFATTDTSDASYYFPLLSGRVRQQ
jgi:hypothetical protein